MAVGIIAIIGTVLVAIWEGIKFVSAKAVSLAVAFLDMMKTGVSWFLKTAPRWLQILFFFFIIIVLADGIMGFFVGLNYACLSDETLRTPAGFAGGVGMYISAIFEDFENSTTDYDQFILDRTVEAQQFDKDDARGIFYVKCFGNDAKFTFAGLDFLNWKYWTIILILGLLFKVGKHFNLY